MKSEEVSIITKALKLGIFSLLVPAVLIASEAGATSQGILGGNIFQSKDVTAKQASFSDPSSAASGDTLLYQIEVGGTVSGGGSLKNAKVRVQFPSGASQSNTSTATVSADNASSVTDTATVKFNKPVSLMYLPGSSKLLDRNGSLIQMLPDTILSNGVSIESHNDGESVCAFGNSKCFVQFEMTSSAPAMPTSTPPSTPPATVTASRPLATAGPESAAATLGLTSLAGSAYALSRSRRRLVQVLHQK